MKIFLNNAKYFNGTKMICADCLVSDGKISFQVDKNIDNIDAYLSDCVILPGLVDVHVHLREPGFSYKETIKTGTMAAAHGGFTCVCTMPNLNPVPDSMETLNKQLEIIKRDAIIRCLPYGAATKFEQGNCLADMEAMNDYVVAFSDDGMGVQSDEIMELAMTETKRLNKVIAAHCEDTSISKDGYIHDGEYAKLHNHKGIPSEAEYIQVKRDIELCEKTGAKYHVCHVSCKESIDYIRKAKGEGIDVTCEVTPHNLILNDMDITEDARFKMYPPIRSEEDRAACVEGLLDGTIDMIATDHAPHSFEEKSKGLEKSNKGVVGLETSFPLIYTEFVKNGLISFEKLIEVMSINPRRRFDIDIENDFTIFDLSKGYEIDPKDFLSMGKASSFTGRYVYGKCIMTVCKNKIVYLDKSIEK